MPVFGTDTTGKKRRGGDDVSMINDRSECGTSDSEDTDDIRIAMAMIKTSQPSSDTRDKYRSMTSTSLYTGPLLCVPIKSHCPHRSFQPHMLTLTLPLPLVHSVPSCSTLWYQMITATRSSCSCQRWYFDCCMETSTQSLTRPHHPILPSQFSPYSLVRCRLIHKSKQGRVEYPRPTA